jgi:hypothetical protein
MNRASTSRSSSMRIFENPTCGGRSRRFILRQCLCLTPPAGTVTNTRAAIDSPVVVLRRASKLRLKEGRLVRRTRPDAKHIEIKITKQCEMDSYHTCALTDHSQFMQARRLPQIESRRKAKSLNSSSPAPTPAACARAARPPASRLSLPLCLFLPHALFALSSLSCGMMGFRGLNHISNTSGYAISVFRSVYGGRDGVVVSETGTRMDMRDIVLRTGRGHPTDEGICRWDGGGEGGGRG